MIDIGIPYALGDLLALRGTGWLSDHIALCEGNTDYPSHIAGIINPDPSICLEALTRVKTNPLDKTLAAAKKAWLIHVKGVTDAQRATVVYDACSFSADDYGWSDILLQGLDSETHETWWTDKLAGELAKSPICLLGDTLVTGLNITNVSRRPYKGEIVTLFIESGDHVSLTPEHPVLTGDGWVPAGQIYEGQQVFFSGCVPLSVTPSEPNDCQVPTPIEEIFRTRGKSLGRPLTRCSPALGLDSNAPFHDGDIDVVGTARFLINNRQRQRFAYGSLALSRPDAFFFGEGSADQFIKDFGRPQGRPMSVLRDGLPILFGGVRKSENAGVTKRSQGETVFFEIGSDGRRTDPIFTTERYRTLASSILPVHIKRIERKFLDTHVYNLETDSKFYHAGGFVVHNCSYVWAHAWATAGIAFGPKQLSSVTPADVYVAALADPSRFDVSEIILA